MANFLLFLFRIAVILAKVFWFFCSGIIRLVLMCAPESSSDNYSSLPGTTGYTGFGMREPVTMNEDGNIVGRYSGSRLIHW
jgi:hypothetical protein